MGACGMRCWLGPRLLWLTGRPMSVCAVQERAGHRVFRACSCREHGRSAVFFILQVLMAFVLGYAAV
jgi:hypothetical protein